jgi:hypothetical protein
MYLEVMTYRFIFQHVSAQMIKVPFCVGAVDAAENQVLEPG